MRVCAVIVCIGIAAFSCERVVAQAVTPDATRGRENPALTTVAESLGTIENRDLLRVRIAGLKPAQRLAEKWVRVADDGTASLPYLGGRKLAGLTTARAEEDIAKGYLAAGIIRGAQVEVRRIEVGSRVEGATVGKLMAGDLVEITVDDLTGSGVTSAFRTHVSPDGQLAVPLLGALDLEGLKEADAERAIAKEYETRGMIKDAVIGVRVVEPAARSGLKAGPIGKGDLLSVVAYDILGPGVRAEFEVRVGMDGAIGFPLVGAVPVEGLSEAKAVEAIANAVRAKNVMSSLTASVCRLESADQADVKLGPIAPGEVLRVFITELVGVGVATVRTVEVDDQGRIAMPLVGGINVGGLTEADAAKAIVKVYRDQRLISNALVSVLKVNGGAPMPDDELRPLPPEGWPVPRARQARAVKP
jgi:protein involved in polysaccharide export with SLBB domain